MVLQASRNVHLHARVSARRGSATFTPTSLLGASTVVARSRLGHILSHRGLIPRRKAATPAQRHPRRAASQFMAGAAGGGSATYCTHWLDTIKVKMQASPSLYPSGTRCLRDTVRQEGVRGLYQGATPAVLGHMSKAAVVFMSYGMCQELVMRLAGKESREQLGLVQHAGAGAVTAVTASFLLCPMEVVKCRMQASQQGSPATRLSPASVLRTTLATEGPRGLYRGLTGMWAKEIPGSFVYFGTYEAARSGLQRVLGVQSLDSKQTFACGVTAGLTFCVMHPVESVKTRVQVATALPCDVTASRGAHVPALRPAAGFCRTFVHILRTEGMRPLWSGMKPSMLRACLFSGIQFAVYEAVKTRLAAAKPDA